jgi:hypothetical protein
MIVIVMICVYLNLYFYFATKVYTCPV